MRQALLEPSEVSLSALHLPWPHALLTLHLARVDAVLRGAVADACARGRQWRAACEVLGPLSVIGCNAAMKGCEGAAWPQPLRFLSTLLARRLLVSSGSFYEATWRGSEEKRGQVARHQDL